MNPGQYHRFRRFLSPEECKNILDKRESQKWKRGKLYGSGGKDGEYLNPSFRDCFLCELDSPSLIEKTNSIAAPLRKRLQFSLGNEEILWNWYNTGEGFGEHYDRISSAANPRILTVSILLSDENCFLGGEFSIDGKIVDFRQGDALIFSALTMHEVSPILSGTRDSLVRWYLRR